MSDLMSLTQIGTAAAALGNQVAAGIPLDQAVSRMGQLQPTYAEFWARALQDVRSGVPLSRALQQVWPETMVASVKAGEAAGRSAEVFERIVATVELQAKLRASVARLLYPIGMGAAGLVVFLGFMIYVLPLLAKSIGSAASKSFIFSAASTMSTFFFDNWIGILGGTIASIVIFVLWVTTPQAKDAILDFLLTIPLVREALRDLYFGLWAHYMALMCSAGIPTTEALRGTAVILPFAMRESIYVFERDLVVHNKTLAAAADAEALPPTDERKIWWPFYIFNAFVVGEHTGVIDKELLRVAPSLLKEATSSLDRVVFVANIVALATSAALIMTPLAAYYLEIFEAIRRAATS